MKYNIYIKTALVVVLFNFYNLNGFSSDLNSVQCLVKNEKLVLTFDNIMISSFSLSTKYNSNFNQNTNSGITTLIMNINQFPAVLTLHPIGNKWQVQPDCTLNKLK